MKTTRRVWLGERIDLGRVKGERVDRDAGVIHGVKILGHESKNGRRYLPEAVKAAAPLYEGVSVRRNHPRKASDQRIVEEVFGWLENVQVKDDGLYADLHVLNPRTELAESVFLAAEKKPDLFGLSHNADGATESRGGETVVLEITEVRSVDLVADPATVSGLFEGKQPMKLKAFLEAIKLPGKAQKAKRRLIEKLFEDDMMDPGLDAPAEAPAADAGEPDHVAALKQGFKAACVAALDDDSLDVAAKVKKLKEILAAEEKLLAKGEPVEEDDDEEESDEEELEECEDDDMKESKNLRRRLKQMETREQVRELCESENFSPSKSLFNALVALPEAERKALIDEQKNRGNAERQQRRAGNQPIPEQKGGSSAGTLNTRDIKDGEAFANLLRRGR